MAKLVYEEFPDPKLGDHWTIYLPSWRLMITVPANDTAPPPKRKVAVRGPIKEGRGRKTRLTPRARPGTTRNTP